MATLVELCVKPVVGGLIGVPEHSATYHLSSCALGLIKTFALAAAVVLAAAWHWRPFLPEKLVEPTSGIELHFPANWYANRWSPSGIEACALSRDARLAGPRMPPRPTTGCRVALERTLLSDFEQICRILGGMDLEPGWCRDDLAKLAHVAAYLGMGGSAEQAQIERVSMAGRPALMLTAPRYDGWGSVVLASGEDVAFLHIYFPTTDDRRRLWPTWLAMMRSVRLTGAPAPVGVTWIPPEP